MIHSNSKTLITALFVCFLFPAFATQGWSCPTCKNALKPQEEVEKARLQMEAAIMFNGPDSPEAERAAAHLSRVETTVASTKGYFYSILFMMISVYVILALMVLWFRRMLRKGAQKKQEILESLRREQLAQT
jgi:hypothetical protein